MNGYMIARFDMIDAEGAKKAYPKYAEAAAPVYERLHARFLVRGGTAHPMEGVSRTRNVVIEYPSLADAYASYQDPVYQAARQHRVPVADGEVVIVEGTVKARPAQEGKKGYWIARYDVQDPTVFKKYVEAGAAAFEHHEALFPARGGPHQALEGQARERNVLVEFPSVKHAIDCYNSDTYQAARAHRVPVSTGEIVIVDGM